MIFNIIPIPPLDGSKVLFSMASNETYWKLMRYERYGMILLFILVASGVLGAPLGRVVRFVFDKLTFFYHAGFDLSLKLF
jgi:Zn-dependent protease